MKKTLFFLLALTVLFGCIEITKKQAQNIQEQDGQNADQNDSVIPPLVPDQNLPEQPPQEPIDQNEPVEPQEPPEPEAPLQPPPVTPPIKSDNWADLIVNSKRIDLAEGEFFEINGAGNIAGAKLKVTLESILITQGRYAARFLLENQAGQELDLRTFFAGEDVFFENSSGDPIQIDGVITVNAVYVG
ncbi:MAG: hypothetical protein HYW50_00620 [Candidatus Diapherotrites archaeon]|nr:hypothetical protein [Candidatus Diapherotrites archaeon]